ncbi:MAG: FAD-dependent oxidoreductase [Thermoplasmata archaeon]|nr:FAD-dependent oxidoreductase [Thermoplasmata archaeon]
METENTIIIIGGGIAGVTAAEAARGVSNEARIVLIHDEPGLPYNRLNLTRLIAGDVEPDKLEINSPGWYQENRIEHMHARVERIIPGEKKIGLSTGVEMVFDRLVIASGANPFVPPIPGADLKNVFTLRTVVQAGEIIRQVKQGSRCVCIGGGLLGIELAAGLNRRGAKVTVLEASDWMLSRQLAPPASAFLRKRLEGLGLSVICGAKVKGISGSDAASGVLLGDGRTLAADLVLISAGVRPNTQLAAEAGIAAGKGITVDGRMATSMDNIFAAGDVAEHEGKTYGLWPIAMEQGRIAGANAAGGSEEFRGVAPSAFLKVVGVDIFSIGAFMPEDESVRIYEEEKAESYLRIAVKGGLVIGCNLLGNISAAQLVRRAIDSKTPLGQNQKLLDRVPGLKGFAQD